MNNKKLILTLFSLLFLLISFITYKNVPNGLTKHQDIDSKAYISNAINFYNYNCFSSPQDSKATPYYSLGYALFIGIIYKIFGLQDFFIIWIQVLLSLFIAFLIFRIAKLLFNESIGIITFAFTLINIGFLTFSQFILTEVLLAFLYTLFLERFATFLVNKASINLIISAFVLGVSIIVKPAAIYFIFFILPLLFLIYKKFYFKFKAILLFSISFYLPVTSYMFFNKLNYGDFSVAPLAKENLYLYFLPKVLAEKNNVDLDDQTRELRNMISGSKLSAASWENVHQIFMQTLKEDPILFIKIWMKNVFKTFVGLFSTNLKVLLEPNIRGGDISFFKLKGSLFNRLWGYVVAGTNSTGIKVVSLFEAIFLILKYLLILIGIVFLLLKKRWAELFLFCSFIFYFSMITGHDGCARFRMMFEPVLILLSSLGLGIILLRQNAPGFQAR